MIAEFTLIICGIVKVYLLFRCRKKWCYWRKTIFLSWFLIALLGIVDISFFYGEDVAFHLIMAAQMTLLGIVPCGIPYFKEGWRRHSRNIFFYAVSALHLILFLTQWGK